MLSQLSLASKSAVIFVTTSLLIAALPPPVQAQLLRGATFREQIHRFDNGPADDPDRPGTVSYTGTRVAGGLTTTLSTFAQTQSVNPSPQLSKVALTVRGDKFVSGGPLADSVTSPNAATIEYFFRVRAASSITQIPIVLPLSWSLEVSRTGSGQARASYQVEVTTTNLSQTVYIRNRELVVRPSNALFSLKETSSTDAKFSIDNGEIHRIFLRVQGHMQRETNTADSTMSFEAFLDPVPILDPTFAAANPGVEIEFSANLFQSAAPEPGTLALLLLGGTLVVVRRRRA